MMSRQTVCFDLTKGTKLEEYNELQSRLRQKENLDVKANMDSFSMASEHVSVLAFMGPTSNFSKPDFEGINSFLSRGHSVLFTLAPGANIKNVNYLFEQFGLSVNDDKVVSQAYVGRRVRGKPLLHPAECLIDDGVVNRDLRKTINKFVYPRGRTLITASPAVPVLSTGSNCYPVKRPVVAVTETPQGGRLALVGSKDIFTDQYITMESNGAIVDWVIAYLTRLPECNINAMDAKTADIKEHKTVPNTGMLAVLPKIAPATLDPLPPNYVSLIHNNLKLYGGKNNLIPEVSQLYETLQVPRGIRLIPPQFEAPLSDLEPAVHPPALMEPYEPRLPLFDVDADMATEDVRLARLVSSAGDLESTVVGMGEVVGINRRLPPDQRTGKAVLHVLLTTIAQFRSFDQGQGMARAGPVNEGDVETFGDRLQVLKM
ncbi:hypothetical protein J8273_4786 [Carpediemonas membranifera]|uniref:Intraflagellar transport protein 52 n=1 Tax=Carpediemonas membranifera TaxID=201153 RepID=A0A8J6E3V3_9EUKA|nr:hypothetical protein J8273_4786 [Carpediemonas membranifera]|eukprot:KAG9393667.1 hypothetical protein J8273_4786 [Carpediemonas membranifera]